MVIGGVRPPGMRRLVAVVQHGGQVPPRQRGFDPAASWNSPWGPLNDLSFGSVRVCLESILLLHRDGLIDANQVQSASIGLN